MAFKLRNPLVQTFVLDDLDPSGEAKITFRQGTIRENQIRDTLVFSQQERTIAQGGIRVSNAVPWSVRQEIEVRLTLAGAEGLLRHDGAPLFKFKNGKLDMQDDEFHEAWGLIHPQSVADILHGHCMDVNPDWDYRAEGDRGENPPEAEESENE
ncbi:MAG TPA: hypothetical protein VMY98_01210 [Anaerolineae bacterium]|nr:hypothetical protein [Anaerolineae bacterium]